MDNNGSVTIEPPNHGDLKPALAPYVHLSLTIVYIILYGGLFLLIYAQLWMILYYKHRRLSYQTLFLYVCLLWAALRTTLFSFYFRNCDLANTLPVVWYWLLYCFPVCLQFITLSLLLAFFSQVVFKARSRQGYVTYKKPIRIVIGIGVLIFLIVNITCAVVLKHYQMLTNQSAPFAYSMVRVVINDLLFIIYAIALGYFLISMSIMPAVDVALEAKGTTKRQALAACICIILLYISRALYNIIAISKPLTKMISFGYGWINVSDQADLMNLDEGFAYVSFGIVLFVWEFLPTFIVVMIFRVKKPNNQIQTLTNTASNRYSSKPYFFDQPRGYDSDEDGYENAFSNYSSESIDQGENSPYTINPVTGSLHNQYVPDLPQTPPPFNDLEPATTWNFRSAHGPSRPGQSQPRSTTGPRYYDGT